MERMDQIINVMSGLEKFINNDLSLIINDSQYVISKYYDPIKFRDYLSRFELYAELMNEPVLPESNKLVARRLFEHYRRMLMSQLTKDINPSFKYPGSMNLKEAIKNLDPKVLDC